MALNVWQTCHVKMVNLDCVCVCALGSTYLFSSQFRRL